MTNNFNLYQKLLTQFVSYKSVSTDPAFKADVEKTVLWLQSFMVKNGFRTEIWKGKSTNPVLFANYTFDEKKPTLLIYGHYDVQPAELSDGWKSNPFRLKESNNKLFARGVADNKGQILVHITTAIKLARSGTLKYNLKFIIEGNEETGNPDIAGLMRQNKKKLKCDVLMVSDGELTNNKPTVEISLRGGFNCTLTYETGKNNLHSGLAGGAVPNAAQELSKLLAKLLNSKNSIAFKDFYRNVDKPTASQLENNLYLAKSSKNMAKLMGVRNLLTEDGYDFFTQTGLRPTIQITGIKAGYINEGYANIVPALAEARINFRIVASQKAKHVAGAFKKFVADNTPAYVDYKISFSGFHEAIKVNENTISVKEAEEILKKVYKSRVNRRNVGGSIPFVGDVKAVLGVDTLLIPLVNEDCNMHGANENFDISLIKKALEFSHTFMAKNNLV